MKRSIIQAPNKRFSHLRNRLVFIGFEDLRGLPPKSTDKQAVNKILDTLEDTDPGPEPNSVPKTIDSNGFQVQVKNSILGQGEAACFSLPLLPHTELAKECGFELAASMTLIVRARDTEKELERIIAQHDKPGNNILLLSAGAPSGNHGFALIGEEIAVKPWIAKTLRFPRPKHINRILLHRWSYGDVYELYPKYKALTAPKKVSVGPYVMPVGRVPRWIWGAPCPCNKGRKFQECHGIL